MRIAAMAAGAVGGYVAARLAAAGHDVFFIARGAHRDAIAKHGPVDIVLFAVKLWNTEKAAEQARPLVGENTRVITLQNGVDSVERIAPILGVDHTIGGLASISAIVAAPGVIRHLSRVAKMHFGHSDQRPDDKLDELLTSGHEAAVH